MSDNEQKINNLASKAGKALSGGAKKAGSSILNGASKSLADLPSKMGKVLLILLIVFCASSFLMIVIFGDYYESGEGGGETGIVDIDHNNKNLSDISDKSKSDANSNSSTSPAFSSSSSGATGNGDDVVEFALQYVGNPYVWGGESLTNGCDCSGFTMKVMENFGVSLPHSAINQRNYGTKVDEADLAPGDLVFYDGPDHVAIYIGNGEIVHAANAASGIKTSSYDYRPIAFCARYVAPGTVSHNVSHGVSTAGAKKEEDQFKSLVANYSPANKAYFNFFLDISKNKSVYQIYDDGGTDVLINPDDPRAVKDYFHNDEDFYISPFLLYSINNHVWGNTYAFPEAFLKPVAHDDNYELIDIADNGKLKVKSAVRSRTGGDTGKEVPSTADYGLASILKYREEDMVDEYHGTYISEDYYNTITNKVEQRTINEPYSFELNREERYVLEWAQSFAGRVSYDYIDTSVRTEGVRSGQSSNPESNFKDILYKTENISVYIIVPITSRNRTAYQVTTATSLAAAKRYIQSHRGYTIYGAVEDGSGNIIAARSFTRHIKLYKHRSTDSGRYTNFVEQSSVNAEEESNDYLDDYLQNFSTYKPTTIDRDPEVFSSFTTVSDNYSTGPSKAAASGGSVSGSGFSAFFNNDQYREIIETTWDTALAYGFSEQQAAAIIGNFYGESGFNTEATNNLGAYGLCQWLDRKSDLMNFASGYMNESGSGSCSPNAQIMFAMMELDTKNAYNWCTCQWMTSGSTLPNGTYSHADNYAKWENSDDIEELTIAMCQSWERPGDADGSMPKRAEMAKEAYQTLTGQSFGKALEVVAPVSGTGNGGGASTTGSTPALAALTEKEKELYSRFYHEADDLYSSGNYFEYVEKGFTIDQRNDTLLSASSLTRGITKQKARLDLGQQLWEEDYILNLSELTEIDTLAGTLDSVDLANQTEFKNYGFIWAFAQDADGGNWLTGSKFSSRFGPRNSPTAGASSNHQGLDIPVPSGTPIYAVSGGIVSYVGDTGGGGYAVYVNHGTNADGQVVESRYFHLTTGSAVVGVGDTVDKGQLIALSDNSGTSTGAHLHLGIAVNGLYYNPLAFYDIKSVPMLKNSGGSVENVDFTSIGSLPSDFDSSYYEFLFFNNGYE